MKIPLETSIEVSFETYINNYRSLYRNFYRNFYQISIEASIQTYIEASIETSIETPIETTIETFRLELFCRLGYNHVVPLRDHLATSILHIRPPPATTTPKYIMWGVYDVRLCITICTTGYILLCTTTYDFALRSVLRDTTLYYDVRLCIGSVLRDTTL